MPMKEGGSLAPLEVVETLLSLTVSDLVRCLARKESQEHQWNYLSCWNQRIHRNAWPRDPVTIN